MFQDTDSVDEQELSSSGVKPRTLAYFRIEKEQKLAELDENLRRSEKESVNADWFRKWKERRNLKLQLKLMRKAEPQDKIKYPNELLAVC